MNDDFFASNENDLNRPVGYDQVISDLVLLQQQNKIMPVNLFEANKGTGKRKLCEYLIIKHLGKSALQYSELNSHPDLLIIEADASKARNEITIEQTRKIKNFMYLTAAQAKNKIILIDAVDNLNLNAANSILKILEEPIKNCYFYLICHDSKKILATILSRANKIKLPKLDKISFSEILTHNNITENMDVLFEIFPAKPGQAIEFANSQGLDMLEAIEQELTAKNSSDLTNIISKYNFKKESQIFENLLASIHYLIYKKITNNLTNIDLINNLNDFHAAFNKDFNAAKKINLEKDNFVVNNINKLKKLYV